MKIYKCLIVDDEPIARGIIENYCSQLAYLQVTASVKNAMEARVALQERQADILFLDINMPVMDGITFLKTLRHPPQVIFTTAYREFAVDAFDLTACDYLLKPFSIERFIVAVDKAMENLNNHLHHESNDDKAGAGEYLFLRADGKIFRLLLADVLYAEANGNYTRVYTTKNMIMPGMSFSSIEEVLPSSIFVRIHRSFIVNKSHITHIEGNRVYIDRKEIPIGSNYKDHFLKQIGLNE